MFWFTEKSSLLLFRVQRDIITSLKLDQNYLFVALHPFNRSNLYYEVCPLFFLFLLFVNVVSGSILVKSSAFESNGRNFGIHYDNIPSPGTTILRNHLLPFSQVMRRALGIPAWKRFERPTVSSRGTVSLRAFEICFFHINVCCIFQIGNPRENFEQLDQGGRGRWSC